MIIRQSCCGNSYQHTAAVATAISTPPLWQQLSAHTTCANNLWVATRLHTYSQLNCQWQSQQLGHQNKTNVPTELPATAATVGVDAIAVVDMLSSQQQHSLGVQDSPTTPAPWQA
jgi:hypothetical protein